MGEISQGAGRKYLNFAGGGDVRDSSEEVAWKR